MIHDLHNYYKNQAKMRGFSFIIGFLDKLNCYRHYSSQDEHMMCLSSRNDCATRPSVTEAQRMSRLPGTFFFKRCVPIVVKVLPPIL